MFKDSGEMNRRVGAGVGIGAAVGGKAVYEATQAATQLAGVATGAVINSWTRNAVLPYQIGAWGFLAILLWWNWDELFLRSRWQPGEHAAMIAYFMWVNTLHAIAMNLKGLRNVHPSFAEGYRFAWLLGTVVLFTVLYFLAVGYSDLRNVDKVAWLRTDPVKSFLFWFSVLSVYPMVLYLLTREYKGKELVLRRVHEHAYSDTPLDEFRAAIMKDKASDNLMWNKWAEIRGSLPFILKPTKIHFITGPLIFYQFFRTMASL